MQLCSSSYGRVMLKHCCHFRSSLARVPLVPNLRLASSASAIKKGIRAEKPSRRTRDTRPGHKFDGFAEPRDAFGLKPGSAGRTTHRATLDATKIGPPSDRFGRRTDFGRSHVGNRKATSGPAATWIEATRGSKVASYDRERPRATPVKPERLDRLTGRADSLSNRLQRKTSDRGVVDDRSGSRHDHRKDRQPTGRKPLTSQELGDRAMSPSFRSSREQPASLKSSPLREWQDRPARYSSFEHDAKEHPAWIREAPESTLPLATAASQFVYGRSAALACLRAARRQIHKAYVQKDRLEASGYAQIILQLCKSLKISVVRMTTPSQIQSMKATADDRPYNGIILDVAPLPYPPVESLGRPTIAGSLGWTSTSTTAAGSVVVHLSLGPQSSEETQANASLKQIVCPASRQPFILLLDGIKDEGNLGNILRTAHFYGVDAVAVCSDATAPVNSSIVGKAASGATEAVPLLKVSDPVRFLERSKENGWQVWASVSPDYEQEAPDKKRGSRNSVVSSEGLGNPLTSQPCILMLGSEDAGLRSFVVKKADKLVTIKGRADRVDVGVDSLNVGTAAAVLIDAFMRRSVRDSSTAAADSAIVNARPKEFKVRKFVKDDGLD
ncbi:hypothetical protein BDZ85DRAFT_260081 [Elsinoe ampelina]|uniref:rRNA methyltransferase 1, mitochondrial n=1 Tax=Elsinoe ampelina TaxID=302913 RepID=A0A6A6GE00_9PEZI|nr:hypothetical protein BDZ85DRAFT_260081 [Elsinoe ampelina]